MRIAHSLMLLPLLALAVASAAEEAKNEAAPKKADPAIEEKLRRYVTMLNSDDFYEREAARIKLLRMGEAAVPYLEKNYASLKTDAAKAFADKLLAERRLARIKKTVDGTRKELTQTEWVLCRKDFRYPVKDGASTGWTAVYVEEASAIVELGRVRFCLAGYANVRAGFGLSRSSLDFHPSGIGSGSMTARGLRVTHRTRNGMTRFDIGKFNCRVRGGEIHIDGRHFPAAKGHHVVFVDRSGTWTKIVDIERGVVEVNRRARSVARALRGGGNGPEKAK